MALTDPELDLLQELLADDPTDDVFLQVAEELNRRGTYDTAAEVLRAGLEAHPNELAGWALLARAALEVNRYDESLAAWDSAGGALQSDADFARIRILALERSGRLDDARDAVDAFEATFDGVDVVVEAAKERMEAPPASGSLSARDPFLTVALAERYATLGREDRAIRVYRRILFRHPNDIAIRSRLEQLNADDSRLDDFTDLSEELADPNLVPPDLTMPLPAITSASVKPAPSRAAMPQAASVPNRPSATPPVDELEDTPTYTAPSIPVSDEEVPTQIDAPVLPPGPTPLLKRKPAALQQFMQSAREAERRAAAEATGDDDEELEELPGLSDVGMSPRKRKKRRSLLKR